MKLRSLKAPSRDDDGTRFDERIESDAAGYTRRWAACTAGCTCRASSYELSMLSLGTTYDLINTAIFLPSGGSGRLRQKLVDALELVPGDRVLELGCGSGQVTARLVEAGARVVAVDALAPMLDAARRRAPRATFIHGDALSVEVGDGFHRVVLSFVLHNFDAAGRRRMLQRAADALAAGGSVGVLEWALPAVRGARTLWRGFLHRLEPSPSVADILDGALDDDFAAAGLAVKTRRRAALGRAQIVTLAKRSS